LKLVSERAKDGTMRLMGQPNWLEEILVKGLERNIVWPA
jgi:hypothetical protein